VLTPNTRDGSQLKVELLKSVTGQPLTEQDLRERVIDFRQRCSHPDAPYAATARQLYRLLLGPAKEELKEADQIVIIPDGMLLTLPFQALINETGQHLLQTAGISYAPSITALFEIVSDGGSAIAKHPARSRGVLAMGVSSFDEIARYRGRNLPWAEEQVRIVSVMLGGRGLIRHKATEATAKRLMGRARYIHFVTHGEVNPTAPMFSSVVLRKSAREDGWLFAQELMDLNLHADLVTLAACQTALGQETRGEGLLGLSWALFVAGAKSSLLTQWEVLDSSTNEVMLSFYKHLKKNGSKGKAKALQLAQLDLMEHEEFRHPYYWAPFTLVGDWR
jgi:CHAT domain-containing protein